MTTTSKLLQVLLLSTLSSAVAQAAETDQTASGAEETFKSLDKDGDQRLSKSEAVKDRSLTTTFVYLDSNGDGYLTMREYTAHLKQTKPKEG